MPIPRLLRDGRPCTWYHPGFTWIDLPIFGSDGKPQHDAGVVASEPGLYFVGLPFLYAERIAGEIAARARTTRVV